MLIAPGRWPLNKKLGPAISEAAEPRYASVCASSYLVPLAGLRAASLEQVLKGPELHKVP